MSKVKNFHKWFTEDIQDWLTWYKKFPDGDISTRFRLRYDNIEVYVRLPREQHYSWISLKNLCSTLDWRIEMEPGDIERLRDFLTAEAKPLLDARAAELAKRQQKAQNAKDYVANLEAENERLKEDLERTRLFWEESLNTVNIIADDNEVLEEENNALKARIVELEILVADHEGWTDEEDVYEDDPLTQYPEFVV